MNQEKIGAFIARRRKEKKRIYSSEIVSSEEDKDYINLGKAPQVIKVEVEKEVIVVKY